MADLEVNSIANSAGTGAPDFPNGLSTVSVNSAVAGGVDFSDGLSTVSVKCYTNGGGTYINNTYYKIGEIELSNSSSAEITVFGTISYSATANIAGKTTIIIRGDSSSTSLAGYFYGETQGNNTITNVAYKNISFNKFEIFIKYNNTYGGLDNFVVTGGVWTSEVSNTGSATAPSGSVQFSSFKSIAIGGSEVARFTSSGLSFDGGSNYLDDYEEGTWTPTLGNGTGITYSSQEGTYRKIGNTVHVYIKLNISNSDNTDTSSVHIVLPFSQNGLATNPVIATLGAQATFLSTKNTQVYGSAVSNNFLFLYDGNGDSIAYNECATSGKLEIAVTYNIY